MRGIKFEVLRFDTKEIIGWERIGERGQWEHNRIKRDNWLLGSITDGQEYSKFIRRQFINKKDKDKTDIYDGDILHSESWGANSRPKNKYHVVEYKGVKWVASGYNGQMKVSPDLDVKNDFKVVGNIYQNPELLSNA